MRKLAGNTSKSVLLGYRIFVNYNEFWLVPSHSWHPTPPLEPHPAASPLFLAMRFALPPPTQLALSIVGISFVLNALFVDILHWGAKFFRLDMIQLAYWYDWKVDIWFNVKWNCKLEDTQRQNQKLGKWKWWTIASWDAIVSRIVVNWLALPVLRNIYIGTALSSCELI